MLSLHYLPIWSVFLAVMLVLPPALPGRTRQGDKLLKQGAAAEQKGDLDGALALYEKAVDQDPEDNNYLIAMRRARFKTSQQWVDRGQSLRSQGKLEEALSAFQRALMADASSPVALQELRRTTDAIARKAAGEADTNLTPLEIIRRDTERRVTQIQSPPDLQPVSSQISSLKMNNQPVKVLYETVAKLAGLNVVFDSQISARTNHNVDLNNIPLDEALDYIALLTKTFWKPVSRNTIFVTDDNVTKRRDYEDEVVKVFYVQNTTSAQEFQEIVVVVRSLTEIRRVFSYNAQRAILVRGTRDQVALAEKLIHDLDRPKAEVVVDVIVMETSATNTRNLALALTQGGSPAGINLPVIFTPGGRAPSAGNGSGSTTTTTGSTLIPLANIGKMGLGDWSTTLPGLIIQAFETDRRARVLQSPQVRASDGMKVSLRLGDRIPYATGSFQPGVGGVGVNPLVSTQFQYADVGVNVDLTPQVHGPDELTLHVELEVSAVRERVVIGGIEQPVIGQRKSVADLRLRSGEISLLGGNRGTSDSRNVNGIPGLVNVPALGILGGQNSTTRERTDLLIALLPRIVRAPDYTLQNTRTIFAGTDQVIKLNYASQAETAGPAAKPDQPAPDAAKPPVTAPAAPPAEPPGTQPAREPKPSGPPRFSVLPAAVQARLSEPVVAAVALENVAELAQMGPLRLKWDPNLLRLQQVVIGNLPGKDGVTATIEQDVRNDAGEATVFILRPAGAAPVSGSGLLFTAMFQAVGKGSGQVTFPEFTLRDAQNQPVVVTARPLPVAVN
jgi:general secretion pathway protein D